MKKPKLTHTREIIEGVTMMKETKTEKIEKILTTSEDIFETEKVIEEAKGKAILEPTKGFWTEKTSCWEMTHCPEIIRNECLAFVYQAVPCWKIEGTYCKLDDFGATGDYTSICQVCRVYKEIICLIIL